MRDYQQQFIEYALSRDVLKFGEFTLKSNRKSPYFFNAGLFNTGRDLAKIGQFYAQAFLRANIDCDMIFGPAYKGIPLASSLAIALSECHNRDIPFCFNRKEAKDHGEGGLLVGSPLKGNVLVVDDVITAGTAIRESMTLIDSHCAKLAGVLIALDRKEKGAGTLSAVQEVAQRYQAPVISIITQDDLMTYLKTQRGMKAQLKKMENYREQYGV